MKRMIDTEKFLDKLLYMGYMDEEKSEVEEVANNMTEDVYTKDEVIAMFTDLQLEIEEMVNPFGTRISGCSQDGWKHGVKNCDFVIQQKINALGSEENEHI